MAGRPHLPGLGRISWLRYAPLRAGVLTGIYASCVFIAWLDVANRVKELEPYAELRNTIAGVLLIAVLAIPVLRFLHHPGRMFAAGLTAWTTLTLTYVGAELHFTLLESRMGAFHVFVLGAVCYGCAAVLDWVFLICAGVREQHFAQTRHAAAHAARRRTR